MGWGTLIVFGSAALALGLGIRLLSPVDINLNRHYVNGALRKSGRLQDDRVSRMQIQRVDVAATMEVNMERVFHRLSLETARGTTMCCLVQVLYPLAILFEERAKQRKSVIEQDQDNYNPYSLSPSAGTDVIAPPKGDPIKHEQEEAEVKNRKIARLNSEIEQLRRLNQVTGIYPQLISFDGFRLITLTDDVGAVRLDDLLSGLDSQERFSVMRSCVQQLAEAHTAGRAIAGELLPGLQHNIAMLGQLAELGLAMWPKQGILLTGGRLTELLAALRPLISALANGEQGMKTGEATPRNFYWDGQAIRQVDWGRARKDLLAVDVVELVCDPAADLTREQEHSLFSQYCGNRGLQDDSLQLISYAAILYRITLSGYICQYLAHEPEMTVEMRRELGGVSWDNDHLMRLWDKLLADIAALVELETLSGLMQTLHLHGGAE